MPEEIAAPDVMGYGIFGSGTGEETGHESGSENTYRQAVRRFARRVEVAEERLLIADDAGRTPFPADAWRAALEETSE